MTMICVETPGRLLTSSAAMLAVLTLCGQASAQESGQAAAGADGQATQLQEVVVEGAGNGTGPVKGYVAKATTAGSKTDTPIGEVPQAVSVVGRDEIDDRGAQQADEALRYTAGVLAQPFGPDSDTNWFFIRGFQATQTGTYMDGLQLQSYSFGGFYVDSFLLERIEVLKGPASVFYGGSNPGGIVDYVSKRPTDEAFNDFEAGIDSFGRGYVDIDGAGGPSDGSQGVDTRFTGRLYGGDGYTDYSDQLLGTISPSLRISPDEATSLTILANYTHLEETHEGGSFLPYYGTVEDAFFGKIDRKFNYTEPDLDKYDREQASIGYEFEHEFDNGWTVRQNARYGFATIEEIALYPFGYAGFLPQPAGDDASLARINFGHGTEVKTLLLDTQVEGKVVTGPVEHTLLGGIDTKYLQIDQLQASNSSFSPTGATTLDPTDPDYGRPQGGRFAYLDEDFSQNQLGVYLQDRLRFVAYMPQFTPPAEGMTVRELVSLGRFPWHGALRRFTDTDRAKVGEALAAAGLDAMAERLVDTLSGGERQRAWLATMVAQGPRCLLLDEPTSALDIAHQVEMLDLVRRLAAERNLSALLVLHDINMAARVCDEIVALRDGRIFARGTPGEILEPAVLEGVYGVRMAVIRGVESGAAFAHVA